MPKLSEVELRWAAEQTRQSHANLLELQVDHRLVLPVHSLSRGKWAREKKSMTVDTVRSEKRTAAQAEQALLAHPTHTSGSTVLNDHGCRLLTLVVMNTRFPIEIERNSVARAVCPVERQDLNTRESAVCEASLLSQN